MAKTTYENDAAMLNSLPPIKCPRQTFQKIDCETANVLVPSRGSLPATVLLSPTTATVLPSPTTAAVLPSPSTAAVLPSPTTAAVLPSPTTAGTLRDWIPHDAYALIPLPTKAK